MIYETITLDITDGLAVLTFDRADVMNALNTQMRAEIAHAVEEAGNDDTTALRDEWRESVSRRGAALGAACAVSVSLVGGNHSLAWHHRYTTLV